jgi:sulfate permease, SulP family
LVLLAPLLSYLPMAAMAALLLMVAWNMSEAHKAVHLLKTAPRGDLWVFLTCFTLTVMFDMVIAITTGILLAAVLFMKEVAEMTRVYEISDNRRLVEVELPEGWSVFKISGPLFFAAADRIFGELAGLISNKNGVHKKGIVLYMDGVSIMDAGGLSAFTKLIAKCQQDQCHIMVADLQFQPLKTLARAEVKPIDGVLSFYPTLGEAVRNVPRFT